MKWAATERVQSTYTFETADEIRALFDTWNIPLSGNTIFWEVEANNGGSKEWKQPVDHAKSAIYQVYRFNFDVATPLAPLKGITYLVQNSL